MKYWEIIADNLSNAGWSWGCVSAIDPNGRTIWIADPHRGDGKSFVVRADEMLTAFMELESATRRLLRIGLTGWRGFSAFLVFSRLLGYHLRRALDLHNRRRIPFTRQRIFFRT